MSIVFWMIGGLLAGWAALTIAAEYQRRTRVRLLRERRLRRRHLDGLAPQRWNP